MSYLVSGECLSALIHRLSQDVGDFEGLLYGNIQETYLTKLKDDGSYDKQTIVSIQNSLILRTRKIIYSSEELPKILQFLPENSSIVGWVAGRKSVPAVPSLSDFSTLPFLLSRNIRPLIFGLFIYKPIEVSIQTDIETGQSANCVSFEYKFFNPEDFSAVKVETENLKETNTKYNSEIFYSVLNNKLKQEIEESFVQVPNLLINECNNYLADINNLIPQAREIQVKLEAALLENIRLKSKLLS